MRACVRACVRALVTPVNTEELDEVPNLAVHVPKDLNRRLEKHLPPVLRLYLIPIIRTPYFIYPYPLSRLYVPLIAAMRTPVSRLCVPLPSSCDNWYPAVARSRPPGNPARPEVGTGRK